MVHLTNPQVKKSMARIKSVLSERQITWDEARISSEKARSVEALDSLRHEESPIQLK
jgi:hypothetical protein